MEMHEIKDRLLKIIQTHGAPIPPERAKCTAELVRAGESEVGFENLCTQFDEANVSLDEKTLRELEAIGRQLGTDARYWERLKHAR
jgi:hypothetical protein